MTSHQDSDAPADGSDVLVAAVNEDVGVGRSEHLSVDLSEGLEAAPGPVPSAGLLPPLDVDDDLLRSGITGILFVADEPVSVDVMAETLGLPRGRVSAALAAVVALLDGMGIEIVEVAGGWRLMTAASARPVLERWIIGARHGRLTQAALETLAVVAYRQPIARVTIGEIRGVNPDGALRSLMARGLVAEVGREDGPGQAVLFGTTVQFLERMGLRALTDLPPLPPYLPDGPAPDEPDASGLAALRKRLRDGSQRLGSDDGVSPERAARSGGSAAGPTADGRPSGPDRLASAGLMGAHEDEEDEDEDAMAPPAARARRSDEGEIVDLSDRLEQAARSAMSRLRHVKATQAEAERVQDATDEAGIDDPEEGPKGG
jgi:segregation and condensation protein B